ncbi:MAG TPA: hypothetical protein VHX12_07040, partial [Acidisoma sp.]|nr:hypothetical protein [Acidisoma sp.]
ALSTGEVRTAYVGGVVPDNWYEPVAQPGRLRRALYEKGMIRIDKALTDNFRLVIKDPALFSACGEFLSPHFRVIAMVRHPLTVLAAWQTVEMPAQRGRIYIAERFHPHLTSIMEAEQDRLDQQVLLVEWLFASYARLPAEDIIRYEDLIASPAETLSRLTPHVGQLRRALHSIDPATRYPGVDLAEIAARLVPKAASFEPFYPDFLASLKPWRTA